MDRFSGGEEVIQSWKCAAYKKFGIGDRVFLSRTGKHFPGLIGSGRIASESSLEPDFEDPEKNAWYVDVRFDYLAKSPTSVVASHHELALKLKTTPSAFTPRKSGYPFPGNNLELETLWSKLIGKIDIVYPDELGIKDHDIYTEGAKKSVTVNRYERDINARNKCIEKHGASCKACGINFGIVYGPALGKRYIHIHHLIPLKDIGREYKIDPINDLVPLCPNCHSMVHQTDPPTSIESLITMIMPRYLNLFK